MSFQPPTLRQEMKNRKIIEDLQQQKKVLQSTQTPASTIIPTTVTAAAPIHSLAEGHSLSSSKRAALQHAHSHSVGYFITQDSSFGNLILPVIPRLDK